MSIPMNGQSSWRLGYFGWNEAVDPSPPPAGMTLCWSWRTTWSHLYIARTPDTLITLRCDVLSCPTWRYDVALNKRRHDIRGGHDDLGPTNRDIRDMENCLLPDVTSWHSDIVCNGDHDFCVTLRGVLIGFVDYPEIFGTVSMCSPPY
jgi:hypothetical protein